MQTPRLSKREKTLGKKGKTCQASMLEEKSPRQEARGAGGSLLGGRAGGGRGGEEADGSAAAADTARGPRR